MVRLSKRLGTIASKIERGSRLADIGSDHALLPVFLAQRGIVASAVAGELNPGPYEAALKQVREAGVAPVVAVRRGDGLSVVAPGEVDVVTIAGMGGSLIVHILAAGVVRLAGVRRLVLQPNVGEEQVRRWLAANGWYLREEDIVEEDGKLYEVLTADRCADAERMNRELYRERTIGGMTAAPDELYRLGPYLLADAQDAFVRKWREETAKLEMIERELARSQQESAAQKRESLRREIERLRRLVGAAAESVASAAKTEGE